MLIAPDGPLHQLPFEALPLDATGKAIRSGHISADFLCPIRQIIATMSAPYAASGKKSTMLVIGDVDLPDQPACPAGTIGEQGRRAHAGHRVW